MDDKRIRPAVWLTVAGVLAALVLIVVVMESRRGAAPGPGNSVPEPQAISMCRGPKFRPKCRI